MSADIAQLKSLIAAAEQAIEQGRRNEGLVLLTRAHDAAPTNPDVLAAASVLTLRAGDAPAAKALIDKAITLDPRNPRYRVNLAMVLRELRDEHGELATLETALTLDPYFFTANLQKGSLLELQGKNKQAVRAYHRALASLRPGTPMPGALRPLLERAQKLVQDDFREIEDRVNAQMAEVRKEHQGDAQDRVDDCLAAFFGRKRIYNSQPTVTHFPRLPAIEFFDRRDFPWLSAVEAATNDIRDELLSLLQTWDRDFVPYVNHDPGTPLNEWRDLNNSRAWSVLFLYKDGKPQPDNIARCPRTLAALTNVPLVDIPGRAPAVFFSRLQPKTRLPPHTGVTNTRSIVHIPLIVPPGCGFRVGSQVREWQPGTALIFDDTIEHEAWNESNEPRTVLIFDVWNPLLTPAERDLMRVATAAIGEYFDSA